MQNVSNDYRNYVNEHKSLTPKCKIVVDNVEYLGDKIKTAPKFSHSNTTFIGGFPAKKVQFEMMNLNNDLDFEGKEIEIYKGLVIDGTIEYVKQGVFIPQANNIETNINSKTISFKNVIDKTQFLDDVYISNLDWTNNQKHSGLEIIQEICTAKNITLDTPNFNFASYLFKQPNFANNITNREVISRMAEIGGEIALFNNNGNLEIKGQNCTNDSISRQRYNKLSREKAFIPNVLILGNKDYNNDIMFPEVVPQNPIEIRIEDNPFVDLYREEMVETIASYVLNISYTPFEITDFIDNYIYELNDVISVADKSGNFFNAVILNIENSSRIKSKISASIKENTISKYNLAGSNNQKFERISFEVNHIKNEMQAVIEKTDEASSKVVEMTVDLDGIKSRVTNTETSIEETNLKLDKNTNNLDEKINQETITRTTEMNELRNSVNVVTEFKEEVEADGVKKVNTGTTIVDIDGVHVDNSTSVVKSDFASNGAKVVDKNTNNTQFFSGVVTEIEAEQTEELTKYINQAISYSDNIYVKNFFETPGGRWEPVYRNGEGHGIGFFPVEEV